MLNLKVKIGNMELKNPVTNASGTFSLGKECGEFVDLNKLGAVVTKGVSYTAWQGNATPRLAEVNCGMLNSIGLQNKGVEYFIKEDIPFLKKIDTKIIVNICGHTIEEYVNVAKRLSETDIDALELNISCPNVSAGCLSFGTDTKIVSNIVDKVKKVTKKTLIVKLTPNVTDITEIAKASEAYGADAVSLINTIIAMKIDIYRRKAVLNKKIGGMSGSAIKPIAVKMVYEVKKAVNIPIIGMGGITNFEDAIEFIMAGATAIAIGTANFANPYATLDALDGIINYMKKYKIKDINELIGII